MREDLYFIRCATGEVKIGKARDVKKRFSMLQCGNPHQLEIIGVVRGRGCDEPSWHERFSHLHIRGEWFRYCEQLDVAIQEAITSTSEPVNPGDPEHPGPWIRRNLLDPLGLNVSDAARRMRLNRPTFSNMLAGKHELSRDVAYRLEALTGVDVDLLMAMQRDHNIAADRPFRQRCAEEIERVPEPA